jgi:signal transduction histidine kinase
MTSVRNIPLRTEVMLGFDQGQLIARSGEPHLLEAVRDPELIADWRELDVTTRDAVDSGLGRVEYLAVPLRDDAGDSLGTFVVAAFADVARDEVDQVVRVAGIVGALALLTASALAVGLAGRILDPVRALSETAQQISEQDLTRRITVTGRDELAQLGEIVNTMLDRLESAFESQRAFLDDTGHELRTPLTIIRGHLEVMGEDPHEVREVRTLVLDEAARMHRIVEDLILLAKAQRPDFLRTSLVDVHTLTREVHAKAEALSAAVTWRLVATADVTISADRQRLTQAMVQLAQNASVHCPPGTVVTIASSVGPDGVRLTVADDGPGIAPVDQMHVFDRFHRGRQSRVESSGTGLGLAIVRAIAEAHGGRVELISHPRRGATFTMVLPGQEATR